MIKRTVIGAIVATIVISGVAVKTEKNNVPNKVVMSTTAISNKIEKEIVFDKNNLKVKSNITLEELDKAFKSIGQPQMTEISMAIIDAENHYNINALFLAGLIAEESGWMKYPAGGGNNLTGYGVYTSTSRGTYFSNKYDNIMATAKLLKKEYLSEGGEHYNGLSIADVNKRYCLLPNGTTDWNWNINITKIANEIKNKI